MEQFLGSIPFVRIEMIFALHDRKMIYRAPKPGVLRKLIEPYFKKWTRYHEAEGHSMPCKRSETMQDTFTHLIKIAQEVNA
jgi:hypothetical protein